MQGPARVCDVAHVGEAEGSSQVQPPVLSARGPAHLLSLLVVQLVFVVELLVMVRLVAGLVDFLVCGLIVLVPWLGF